MRSRGDAQGLVEGQQAEAHVEGIGELPAEDVARVPVEYGGQVKEALGHRHVGDVRAPDLVGGGSRAVPEQVGIGGNVLTGNA